jgi:hypothetical protein
MTEFGSSSVFRRSQPLKRPWGIFVRCDGVSDAKEDNLEHPTKTKLPRVETEEGTVKDSKL